MMRYTRIDPTKTTEPKRGDVIIILPWPDAKHFVINTHRERINPFHGDDNKNIKTAVLVRQMSNDEYDDLGQLTLFYIYPSPAESSGPLSTIVDYVKVVGRYSILPEGCAEELVRT